MIDALDQKVRQIAADVLNIPLSRVTAQTSPEAVEGWDSVQQLNFVLALEAGLGISIEPEEIERIRTVGAAIEVARSKSAG